MDEYRLEIDYWNGDSIITAPIVSYALADKIRNFFLTNSDKRIYGVGIIDAQEV